MKFAAGRTLLYAFVFSFFLAAPSMAAVPTAANPAVMLFGCGQVIFVWLLALIVGVKLDRQGDGLVRAGLTQLNDMQWQVCLECGQPVAGLGDSGHCPECGEAFQIDENRGGWKERLGKNPEAKPSDWNSWKHKYDTMAFIVWCAVSALV